MVNDQKIHGLEDLAAILADHRAAGKQIVHCHGVFDLLHVGHLRHFEQAKANGDILVVTLTPDRFVNVNFSSNQAIGFRLASPPNGVGATR